MSDSFQLREVFNLAGVTRLAQNIQRTWPKFDTAGFTNDINTRLEQLSFGDRNALIRDTLKAYLPEHFPDAAQILIETLGPELSEPELTGFDGFIIMPQCDFIALYGLDDYDISMKALYEMTKRFTAEGAIRAFINKYPEQTLQQLEDWSRDENCHVRRLVSEGTRPRLPLAPRLNRFIEDPRPVLKLLDNLKTDPVLLVRRSVANNLNDIAKDNPELVTKTLKVWQEGKDKGTQWIIRHASRTLVKQGNKEALVLLGYPSDPEIRVNNLALDCSIVNLGEGLKFNIEIQAGTGKSQNLMIDYVIHHMKANGKLAPKVFKLTKKKLKPGEQVALSKTHLFKPINTRKYYAGRHRLELQINGTIWAAQDFELKI